MSVHPEHPFTYPNHLQIQMIRSLLLHSIPHLLLRPSHYPNRMYQLEKETPPYGDDISCPIVPSTKQRSLYSASSRGRSSRSGNTFHVQLYLLGTKLIHVEMTLHCIQQHHEHNTAHKADTKTSLTTVSEMGSPKLPPPPTPTPILLATILNPLLVRPPNFLPFLSQIPQTPRNLMDIRIFA